MIKIISQDKLPPGKFKTYVDWYCSNFDGMMPQDIWEWSQVVWNESAANAEARTRKLLYKQIDELADANSSLRAIIKHSKAALEALKRVRG